jgi:hypothetical protein
VTIHVPSSWLQILRLSVFVVQSRQFLPGNPALAESRRLV